MIRTPKYARFGGENVMIGQFLITFVVKIIAQVKIHENLELVFRDYM